MRVLAFTLLISSLSPCLLSAQELFPILEAHYKAAAQEKMVKVQTITTRGKNVYSKTGFESGFTIYQARPLKLRVESDYQGSKVIQTYNGETGWQYAPAMGMPEPVEIKGQELETLLSQIQFENPLWNYSERGDTLAYADQDSEETDHLALTTASGDIRHYFIDRESHLISRITTTRLLGGSETEIEILFNDYKSVKGIPFAHQVVTRMNGEVVATIYLEKVEVNKKIDPALFEKPDW
ncbi:MAG: hypothetical protein ABFS10_13925 [Bacteroidota bacterium]